MRTRHEVRAALKEALEPLPYARAAWEAGSTAFGRDDDLSDLDLHVLVDDDRVEETFAVVEDALAALGGIACRYRPPEPQQRGYSQAFYRLVEGAPYLVVDLVVMRRSAVERFLTRERHGDPLVLFDETGEVAAADMDPAELHEMLDYRLGQLRALMPMFADFVDKDLARGNRIGALASYHAFVLRPLTELLGIRYCPARHDFGPRYAVHDLPPAVMARLEALWLVPSTDDLAERRRRAQDWFEEVLAELDERAAANRSGRKPA